MATSTTDTLADMENVCVPKSSAGDEVAPTLTVAQTPDSSINGSCDAGPPKPEPEGMDVSVTLGRRPPTRFLQVEGVDGRTNDLVYCPPLQPSEIIRENGVESTSGQPPKQTQAEARRKREQKSNSSKVVIFFGGDIQDFPEAMAVQTDNRALASWNLDSTAVILQDQFPTHHIVVVRPSRMQMLTYSCFDNFVPSNNIGVPDHTPNHGALQHAEALLRRLSGLIQRQGDRGKGGGGRQEADSTDDPPISTSKPSQAKEVTELNGTASPTSSAPNLELSRGQLTLIGFSKGCVVLNQFIYEFHYLKTLTPDDETLADFLDCIEDMYFLDGGHNGGKNTWLTSRSLLETLTRLGIRIQVHMTPYQLCDDRRPWIGKEERIFSDSLRRYGASIRRYVHFEDEQPSLALHLQLLATFSAPSTSEPDEEEDDYEDPDPCDTGLSGSIEDNSADELIY